MTPELNNQINAFIHDRFFRHRIIRPGPDGRYDLRKLDIALQMSGGRAVTVDCIEEEVFKKFGVRVKLNFEVDSV